MPSIESHVDCGLSVITLNDSAHGNLLNRDMLESLDAALRAALEDDAVRVVLLRSDGDAFCLGMDLSKLDSPEAGDGAEDAGKAISLYVNLLSAIHSAPKPVVCLLHGEVKAGGIGLVSACDIVLSSEKTTLELSEIFFGLIPANVLPFLLCQRLPPQKARYLVLTGKRMSAREARQLNLIDEVFPDEELEKATRSVVRNLFRSSPAAMAEAKAFTRALLGKDLAQAQSLAKEKLLELIAKPEVRQAVSAFREGGTPAWFGKFKPEKPLRAKGGEG